MTRFGYTLMTEQSGPRELVAYAVAAERAGFDFEVMSDHFSPWLTEQGHAPYAWTILGAVAHATERVDLMTYVTCPTLRYHPAVVAQKAATLQLLAEGRFTLGLGSGENLNEHVVGEGWPAIAERQDMLAEAIEVIRALHTGELVDHRGEFFQVDSARIWDLPEQGVDIGVAVAGDRAIERFAPLADHLVAVEPKAELVDGLERAPTARRASAATPGPSARSRSAGTPTRRPRSRGRTSSSAGSAAAGRSTPTCRRRPASPARRQFVRPEDVADSIPCGPDLDAIVEAVSAYWEAGFTDVALVQVGDEGQDRFLAEAAGPLLEKLRAAATLTGRLSASRGRAPPASAPSRAGGRCSRRRAGWAP